MRIVNVRAEKCTHYIGRSSSYNAAQHGINALLGNPFVMGWHGVKTRQQAVEEFERFARANSGIMLAIKHLPKDAVLGCWCKPLDCHGDVVVKIWKELHP